VAIVNVIDAEMQPGLKNQLIANQLNTGMCRSCGAPVQLAVPLVYHDADKQFCFVHIPPQLANTAQSLEIEQFVGKVTTALMNNLPAEASKAYLLAPRRFLSMQTLIEGVLEGDGITKEMIEAQRRRVDVIGTLLDAMLDSDASLVKALELHRDDINDEFMATLAAFVDASQMGGDTNGIAQLTALQSKLLQFIGGDATIMYEALIDKLLAADSDDAVRRLVAGNQETIDYTFFDVLTSRITAAQETSDEAHAERLTQLRDQVLTHFESIQAGLELAYRRAGEILDAVFAATDIDEALRAHVGELDDVFDILVDGQRVMAERAGDQAAAERLHQIAQRTTHIKEAALSPEDRTCQALIASDNPTKYIRENISDITGTVVKRLNDLAEEYTAKGNEDIAERVRKIAREAGAMLW
jgi:hypothetical protein